MADRGEIEKQDEKRVVNLDDDGSDAPLPAVEENLDDEDGKSALPRAEGSDEEGEDEATVQEMRQRESLFDKERNRITEGYAERRRKALGMDDEGTDGESAAADGEQGDQPPARRKVPLKVNGIEVDLDEEDVVRIAQESLAAGLTLQEAKERAARLVNEPAKPEPGKTPAEPEKREATDQKDPEPSKTRIDPARLSAVVEKLQVGAPEDAVQELGDFLNEVLSQQQPQKADKPEQQPNVEELVQQTLARNEARRGVQRAMTEFAERFEPLAKDEDMTNAVFRQVSREIIDDFRKIGMPPEDIAQAEKNPGMMIEGYHRLRGEVNPKTGKPWGLRDYREILFSAGDKTAQKFNVQLPDKPGAETGKIVVDPSRRAAKDSLTQQPRSAGLRADAGRLNGSQSQQAGQSRSRGSDIVAEQRRARGFPG